MQSKHYRKWVTGAAAGFVFSVAFAQQPTGDYPDTTSHLYPGSFNR